MQTSLSVHRKKLLTITLLALIGVGLAFVSWNVMGKSQCPTLGVNDLPTPSYIKCTDLYHDSLYAPMIYGFFLKSIILSSLILLLFSARVYKAWRWFALIAIPFMLIGIIFPIHEPGGQFFGKKETSDAFGYFFLGVTILIVIIVTGIDWFKKRGSSRKETSQKK